MPNFSGIWTINQQAQAKGQGIWPTPPNAPTIGTATVTGATTVSVTFTAPSNAGYPTPITGYTVTSSPGGLTGSGASSPITVTGLTTGTAYTFTVRATNATGTGPASAASNSVSPALAVGDAYGGGYFAGQINVSSTVYNLVVADKTVGQIFGKKWGTTATNTGITSVIDGPTNSASLAALGANYEAAIFCEGLNTGGYTDWYLPALNELSVCYYFLKPGTVSNVNYFGSNANAVSPQPVSTNYTAGSPTQTSATTFRTGASGQEFPEDLVWTSTQQSNDNGYVVQFINGNGQGGDKVDISHMYTRAIRRVLA
jgi:hypothetical protein